MQRPYWNISADYCNVTVPEEDKKLEMVTGDELQERRANFLGLTAENA